jgi:small subunit ribosomal protein S20
LPSARSARVHERRRERNAPIRSRAKTLVAKTRKLVDADESDEAKSAVAEAIVALDKAAQKGVIHANNAARRKSRVMKLLNRSEVQ